MYIFYKTGYFLHNKDHTVHNLRQTSTNCSLLYECGNCNFGGKCMVIYIGGCVFQLCLETYILVGGAVGVQDVRWDKGGSVTTGDYDFFYGK